MENNEQSNQNESASERNIQRPEANKNFSIDDNPYIWRIGFGRRFAAYLIDSLFLAVVSVIVVYVTGIYDELMSIISLNGYDINALMTSNFMQVINERIVPLSLAIGIIYNLLEVFFAASPGKMLLEIVIGSEDKKFASFAQLFLRFSIKNINYYATLLFVITGIEAFSSISSILGFIVFVGFFAVLGIKKQALHDLIAKTAVYFKDELKQLDNKE